MNRKRNNEGGERLRIWKTADRQLDTDAGREQRENNCSTNRKSGRDRKGQKNREG